MSNIISPADYLPKLQLLASMANAEFDWESHYENGGVDASSLGKELYRWHNYAEGDRPVGTRPCGGFRVENTPLALYRAIWLIQPASVDFSDNYKSGSMIDVLSPCQQFHLSLQFFKYELQVYQYCVKEHHQGDGKALQGGWADCDNGYSCSSDLGNQWFQTLKQCLNHEWMIYSGNDFKV